MSNHQFHKKIGEVISQNFGDFEVLKDSACGGKSLLSLCYDLDRYKSEFSEVDMIILKKNKVKIIFEIEESNVTPTQVCGKVMAAALSKYCFPNNKKANNEQKEIDDSVLFVQILNKDKIRSWGNKAQQIIHLEKAINESIQFSNIKKYTLYQFSMNDNFIGMIHEIRKFLQQGNSIGLSKLKGGEE